MTYIIDENTETYTKIQNAWVRSGVYVHPELSTHVIEDLQKNFDNWLKKFNASFDLNRPHLYRIIFKSEQDFLIFQIKHLS
jgi:hypothetical protein